MAINKTERPFLSRKKKLKLKANLTNFEPNTLDEQMIMSTPTFDINVDKSVIVYHQFFPQVFSLPENCIH